eukprot:7082514-Prymnesium_polylepis.1
MPPPVLAAPESCKSSQAERVGRPDNCATGRIAPVDLSSREISVDQCDGHISINLASSKTIKASECELQRTGRICTFCDTLCSTPHAGAEQLRVDDTRRTQCQAITSTHRSLGGQKDSKSGIVDEVAHRGGCLGALQRQDARAVKKQRTRNEAKGSTAIGRPCIEQ